MKDYAKEISAKRRAWSSAVNSGDIEDYLSVLAENIIWFPPGDRVISGKNEFRKWVEPFFGKFEYEFSLSQIKLKIANNWAIEQGVFTSKMTPKSGEEMMQHSGKYIVFWHRKNDGEWEIERYIDNTEN